MNRIDRTYHMAMIRGDTFRFSVRPLIDGEPVLEDGDTIYFTVKKNEKTEEVILQKVITVFTEEQVAIVEIRPEDTRGLPYKVYRYDIQLTRANGDVHTIVTPSDFEIAGEVTHD